MFFFSSHFEPVLRLHSTLLRRNCKLRIKSIMHSKTNSTEKFSEVFDDIKFTYVVIALMLDCHLAYFHQISHKKKSITFNTIYDLNNNIGVKNLFFFSSKSLLIKKVIMQRIITALLHLDL